MSAPVQGPGGWYLVKAADRTPGGGPAVLGRSGRRSSASSRGRKRFAALEAWLDAARDKAAVTRP